MDKNIGYTLTDTDFLQQKLDLSEISPAEFENLVFQLIDEMGFSNGVWRKGGPGNSSNDGGRDLEASAWEIGPARSSEKRYWFEVKFRSSNLEKREVQAAVLNAAGNNRKDHLVIVTNSTISNPCLDWIEDFRQEHKVPEVTVWQGHDLEILLRKNPATLAKFLPTSLSLSGRVKLIESRFFNMCILPSLDEVQELWRNLDSINANLTAMLAAILAKSAHGDLVERPWGMEIDETTLLGVTVHGVANLFPLFHRSLLYERDQDNLIPGLAYLIQCVLVRYGADLAAQVLTRAEEFMEDSPGDLPDEVLDYRIRPILSIIYDDLAHHCSANFCMKLHYDRDSNEASYFARFDPIERQIERKTGFLVMNSNEKQCDLGLVATNAYCPLGEDLPDEPIEEGDLARRLDFARRVIVQRNALLKET